MYKLQRPFSATTQRSQLVLDTVSRSSLASANIYAVQASRQGLHMLRPPHRRRVLAANLKASCRAMSEFREKAETPKFGLRVEPSSIEEMPKAAVGSEALVFSEFLDALFEPLLFPPELARRTLTHASHKLAPIHGHGGRFSFLGRRVLQAYMTIFLQTYSTLNTEQDFQSILDTTLSDATLGAYVAPAWELNSVLLWNPPLDRYTADRLSHRLAEGQPLDDEAQNTAYAVFKQAGMHKIMGDAVQAIFGGIFHQFGGEVAHRIFHTRILPHLDLPKVGVPEPFRTRQLELREKLTLKSRQHKDLLIVHENPIQDAHIHGAQ